MSKELKPIHIEELNWKGVVYVEELYNSTDFSGLSPITQVQAVCFTEDNQVVLYEHVDCCYGLPGGHLKEGESFEDGLRRELNEEISSELISYKPIGYIKCYKKGDSSDKSVYHLRYQAKVKLLEETPDPDGKALKRILVAPENASEKLGWGEKGILLIEMARKI